MMILYGLLLTIPFALNLLASRDDYKRFVDALNISAVMATIWSFTTFAAFLWEFPESKKFHSLLDLIGVSVCIAAYMTQRQRWKLVLASLFLTQLYAHVCFQAVISPPESLLRQIVPFEFAYMNASAVGRVYVTTLNLVWFAQLVCVGWSGGVHVGASALNHLRNLGRLPDPSRT